MSRISCIISPPSIDYYYMFQRPQQLMRAFSELKIRSYFMSRSYLFPRRAGIEQINPYLYILNQVDIKPYLNGSRPVVYFSSPDDINKVDEYNPALVVFDSLDEPSGEFSSWKTNYYRALTKSDIVLASSEKLYEQAAAINPSTYLIPNACDYDFFSQAAHKNLPVPQDITNIKGPVIGYCGAVATWCDLDLIEILADSFADCHIVIIGPLYNVSQVPLRPNLHWLGMKPYNQLPGYLQCFDVGIIPFKTSSMTRAVNPIKMWEYLAVGMPVVTTDLPEAGKYPGLVLCSENYESFKENLMAGLYGDKPSYRLQRQDVARWNSWKVRAWQVIKIIEENLALKGEPDSQIIPMPLPQISQQLRHQHAINVVLKSAYKIDMRKEGRQYCLKI